MLKNSQTKLSGNLWKKRNVISLLSFLFFFSLSATIINVPAEQPTIQSAINISVNGDTILVQPGTYQEIIDYVGKNINIVSLFLTTQDTTFISQTIIDGNQSGCVVTFENDENLTAVLSGFTITNGSGEWGGGIRCLSAEPTISDVIVENNFAIHNGGGIYLEMSDSILRNAVLRNNTAHGGGGIFCWISDPDIRNVNISNNSTTLDGGGVYLADASDPVLINVIITGNSAYEDGGGIYCGTNCSPILKNCIIANNFVHTGRGGSIMFYSNTEIDLENILISGNSANTGGGIYSYYSYPNFMNCILRNDSPEEIVVLNGDLEIFYSDIQGDWEGEGNLDIDPLFDEELFTLLPDSPCIDAGNPDQIYNDPEDPYNFGFALFPAMGTIQNDMGAFGGPNTISWNPPVSIDDDVVTVPNTSNLYGNYPNPFNPTTTIPFFIADDTRNAEINIYNIKGQKIKGFSICDPRFSIEWDGKDGFGKFVGSGIYFYDLRIDGRIVDTKKCMLIR